MSSRVEALLREFKKIADINRSAVLGRLACEIVDCAPRGKVKDYVQVLSELSGESSRTLYRWMERARNVEKGTADATHD